MESLKTQENSTREFNNLPKPCTLKVIDLYVFCINLIFFSFALSRSLDKTVIFWCYITDLGEVKFDEFKKQSVKMNFDSNLIPKKLKKVKSRKKNSEVYYWKISDLIMNRSFKPVKEWSEPINKLGKATHWL